jgi:hypothetical protein
MASTPIYNWPTPDNTDLVKNGALAIRTLGDAIDTTVDTMIPETIFAAKGDLLGASANDTPEVLSVGANGETLVADSSTSTGLRYQANFAAGKNKIINGDMSVWQRSTNQTTTVSDVFLVDRFFNTQSDGTCTFSVETFTAGAAPVAGYEAKNYLRMVTSGQTLTSAIARIDQRIEDVRTLAGQTVTVSFWAQAGSGTPSVAVELQQNFGTGGSPSATVNTIIASPAKQAITTSWVRYSYTIAIPSISGKTLGTNNNSFLLLGIIVSAGSNFNARTDSLGIQSNTFNIWGVQVEAGSVATAFQTATGTIQGELAACQRYYNRFTNGASAGANYFIQGTATTTTIMDFMIVNPVTFRVTPTAIEFSNLAVYQNRTATSLTTGTFTLQAASGQSIVAARYTHGSGVFNAGADSGWLTSNTAAANYIAFTAEL